MQFCFLKGGKSKLAINTMQVITSWSEITL